MTREEILRQRKEETPEARDARRRDLVRDKLRRMQCLYLHEHRWLDENPDQVVWLKDNMEAGAWSWYEKIKAGFNYEDGSTVIRSEALTN